MALWGEDGNYQAMNSDTPRTDTLEEMGCLTPTFLRQLEREINTLRQWKQEALLVESEWDEQHIAKLLGAKPGESCRKVIMKRVPEILKELEEAQHIILNP